MSFIIKVIIPAFNEEASIGKVISEIPDLVSEIIVVSNNSSDQTETVAKMAGATVLRELQKGYGFACLKGLEYIASQEIKPDIVVFLDGDYSDYPQDLHKIVAPIINNDMDLVIGSRVKRWREKGSMTFPQVFGNWLATSLMKLFFNAKFHRSRSVSGHKIQEVTRIANAGQNLWLDSRNAVKSNKTKTDLY